MNKNNKENRTSNREKKIDAFSCFIIINLKDKSYIETTRKKKKIESKFQRFFSFTKLKNGKVKKNITDLVTLEQCCRKVKLYYIKKKKKLGCLLFAK